MIRPGGAPPLPRPGRADAAPGAHPYTARRRIPMASAKPIPDGYHAVTPYLIVKGAARAIDFYVKALGARELFRVPQPDGRVDHAELRIGDSRGMLADEHPEIGARRPPATGGAPP